MKAASDSVTRLPNGKPLQTRSCCHSTGYLRSRPGWQTEHTLSFKRKAPTRGRGFLRWIISCAAPLASSVAKALAAAEPVERLTRYNRGQAFLGLPKNAADLHLLLGGELASISSQ